MNTKIQDVQDPIAALKSSALSHTALIFITSLLLLVAIIGYYNAVQVRTFSAQPTIISSAMLEEKYGLRVNLIAVTAAGGFVDVRIKILDAEKARLLLSDKKNFPAVLVNNKVILNAPEDTKSQEIKFEKDNILFIIYPNSAGIVKPGIPVKISFGNLALEAINSK